MLNVDCNQQTGRQVSCWANFHLLWWALLPAPCFGISAWGFQQLQVGVAKGLQCVAFLIKTLLHSHNVIDTCPNPNNIRYRSTCGSGWLHRLYGFYDFTSFKQEGKEVQVWHDKRGRSWQLQASARVQAAFPSLILHLHNSLSMQQSVYKELRSMDSSSMYGCNEPTTAPVPNCVTATTKLGTGHISQFYVTILL